MINFQLPDDSKTYIHRVGRTARAGRAGKSINLVTQYDLEYYMRIEQALGKKMDQYEVEKDQVMLLHQRVGEAQREAVLKMKELHEKRGRKKGTSSLKRVKTGRVEKSKDDMDLEEEL